MAAAPNRQLSMIEVLAMAQAALILLRTLRWFEIGSDLLDRGILILPVIAIFAYAPGAVIVAIALLYATFAWGEFAEFPWARSCGVIAGLLNLALIVGAVAEGEAVFRSLLWAIVPLMILCWALSPERSVGKTAHA